MAEGYITLPPDSTGKKVRFLQVSEQQSDGSFATEYQEAVVLASEDGGLLSIIEGGSLQTADDTTRELLLGICRRLDLLCHTIDSSYVPPDEFGCL